MSTTSPWMLVPPVLSYFFDISEGQDMCSVWHGTTGDRLCYWCVIEGEGFCIIDCAGNRNVAGTLNSREYYAIVMDEASEMEAAILGQIREEEMLYHSYERVKTAPALF